jgi:hypothetical protein
MTGKSGKISNYPGGFNHGLTLRNVPLAIAHPGNVFWVDSGAGSDGYKGTYARPFATLDYAIGQCAASNGDIIYMKPGHAEDVAAASSITVDVAGVAIIGLGSGALRPTFSFQAAASTIVISAASVSMVNMICAASFADVLAGLVVTAASVTLDSIEFTDEAAALNWLSPIKATGTTDNEADNLSVTNCRWSSIDAAGLEFVEINADLTGGIFNDNFVSCDAATACKLILVATGKDLRDLMCIGNYVVLGNTAGDLLIDNDTTANSGMVAHNRIGHHDTAGEVLVDADGVRQFDNLGTATDTASGYLLPAVDS